MTAKQPTEPKMVEHKLDYEHDHNGEIVPAGETITVTERQAERIKRSHAKRKVDEAEAKKASAE